MSPPPDEPRTLPPSEDDEGPPILALRSLALDVDERFARRVRGRIERRVLAGDLVSLGWSGPLAVLLECLRASLGLLGPRRQP